MSGSRHLLSARRHLFMGFATLALVVAGLGGWAVITRISGAIVANGQLEVEQNRQVVQHPDGGVVELIAVEEGSKVKAGDLLLRLDGNMLKSELAIIENQLFELNARRARLEAERNDDSAITFPPDLLKAASTDPDITDIIDGQTRLFEARRETMAQQVDQLDKQALQIESQIQGIEAQIAALDDQVGFLDAELSNQKSLLDKGLTQAARVMELQREAARLKGEIGGLTADRAQAEGRITEIKIERLKLQSQRREDANTELRDVAFRELDLAEQRRSLIERIDRLDVRAPVSGLVLDLRTTTPRSVIRAADPILYIVPQDRPLIIAANIPTIHIDEVRVGQDVRLRFSAFSSRTTPDLEGKVTVVSADAMRDEKTGATFYRVEIALNPGQMDLLPGKSLVPGMPVEAFIRTEDRTPFAYLIGPFREYFDRAFRES